MISNCPHCKEELNLSPAQQAKVENALARLKTGTLRLGCPHCGKPIELLSDGSLADIRAAMSGKGGKLRRLPEPPPPPDIQWLLGGEFDSQEEIRDIPKALVLVEEGGVRDLIVDALVESFYQPMYASDPEHAIDQMALTEFSLVVLQDGFGGKTIRESSFHRFMLNLPMSKRRYLLYCLVGKDFHSLYGLEALSFSANFVVNEGDAAHFKNILKRAKSDYDELFGPYISVLEEHGVK
jgi:hypothetical protein